jgi:hypothetical protein
MIETQWPEVPITDIQRDKETCQHSRGKHQSPVWKMDHRKKYDPDRHSQPQAMSGKECDEIIDSQGLNKKPCLSG